MRKRRQTSFGLVLALVALLGGQIIFGTPVFGVTDSTISISTNTSLALSLMPGAFGSTSQSVTVTTNNYTGYTVQLTNPNNATELVNTNNNNYTIPTVTLPQGSNSITANQFSVGYGFSTDGTNYVPAPNSSSNIPLGNRSTAGSSSHSLYLGVKSAGDAAAGTYSKAYTITAVVNNPQYSITYDANAGNDTVTGMPSNVSVTPSSTGTVTLSSDAPTRSNYTFLGWDTSSSATTPTYTTGNTNIITLEPTQANAITLYAIWQQSSGGGGSGTPSDPYIDTTTTNATYNPSNQTPGTSVVYESVEGQPQVTVDSNGNISSFAFTDTSGVSIDDAAIDTGYIPFDGSKDFEIYIKAQFPPNYNNKNGSTSTYLGILLDVRDNREAGGTTENSLQITYGKNGTKPVALIGRYTHTLGLATISGLGSNIFEATITYNHPTTPNGTGLITIVYNNNGTNATYTENRTLVMANTTIYLGYTVNTQGNVNRQARNTTVYEFRMRDL